MAAKTQYYDLAKPSLEEIADIEPINTNMDKIDLQMRRNEDGVNFAKSISSDAYDHTRTYAVGEYCIYDNKFYKCTVAIESEEEFNAEHWEQTTCGKEIADLRQAIGGLTFSVTDGTLSITDGVNTWTIAPDTAK